MAHRAYLIALLVFVVCQTALMTLDHWPDTGTSARSVTPANTDGMEDEMGLADTTSPTIDTLFARAKEIPCITDDFHDHFRRGTPGSNRNIGVDTLKFSVTSYRSAVDGIDCSGKKAVVVHNGLSADGRFIAALEIVCLDPKGDGFFDLIHQKKHYTIEGGALRLQNTSISTWKPNWTRYKDSVVCREEATLSFRSVIDTIDVQYIVFPHEDEIYHLIDHNPGASILGILPTAEPLTTAYDDFRQGLVWIPLGIELTNDVDSSSAFKHKGADLGAPCPKDCPPKVSFKKNGVPVRTPC